MSERRRASRVLLEWVPALGLMAIIFVLSSQSGLRMSEDASVDRPLRAMAHFTVYALLAAALLVAIGGATRASARSVTMAFALALLFGLSDEIHQAFVPGRTGQVEDLLVDALGALVGAWMAYLVLRRR